MYQANVWFGLIHVCIRVLHVLYLPESGNKSPINGYKHPTKNERLVAFSWKYPARCSWAFVDRVHLFEHGSTSVAWMYLNQNQKPFILWSSSTPCTGGTNTKSVVRFRVSLPGFINWTRLDAWEFIQDVAGNTFAQKAVFCDGCSHFASETRLFSVRWTSVSRWLKRGGMMWSTTQR